MKSIIFNQIQKKTKIIFIGLIVLILATGCKSNIKPKSKQKKKVVKKEIVRLKLYFSDKQAQFVIPELRVVEKSDQTENLIVEELIKGPKEKEHFAIVPKGTRLNSITIKDQTAFVDFSRELKEKHSGGGAGEIMTIFGIVNSLTELPEIKKVQILIDGNKVEGIGEELYDLREPIERREDLISRED
ncbi:MAG: GerMN domain-containing protein [Actinobacteria bacterium]|nr:GerMN domain-containing protein [Actinomycetota bacterium]